MCTNFIYNDDMSSIILKYVSVSEFQHIINKYNESHRYHHTLEHINSMYSEMIARDYTSDELILSILFHDIIYDPLLENNEELSAEYAKNILHTRIPSTSLNLIYDAILSTKFHKPVTDIGYKLCKLDLSILNKNLDVLIKYERKLFKEYQFVDYSDYKCGRIQFLNRIIENPFVKNTASIHSFINYIETFEPKIGVYAGSFNPFHQGHLNILNKAEQIFDKVIIAQGINPDKSNNMIIPITDVKLLKYHQTSKYSGLLTDYIKSLKYKTTLVRGLRNITDLQAELNQYRYIRII